MKNRFTLVEMIIVIVILAILSAIVIPNISNMKSKGMVAMLNSNIRILQTAVDTYALDHNGEFPTTISPNIGKPQLIQFDKLYPNYIKSLSKEEGISKQNYWVDYSGRVWGSTVDAPSNFYYASGNLEWNHERNIHGYNIYEIKEKTTGSLKSYKTFSLKKTIVLSGFPDKIRFDLGENRDNYLISAIDQYGLETAPVDLEYEGKPQIAPILKQEGIFYFEFYSDRTLYWDGFKAVEDKPEGTQIEYSFAVGDDPNDLNNFVSDFYSLEPAKHMRIKVHMISHNGKYPSLYDLRVYYHYEDEIVLESRRVAESANRVIDEVKLENGQYIDQIIVTDSYQYGHKPSTTITYSPDGANYYPVTKISDIPSGSYVRIEREGTNAEFKNPIIKVTDRPPIVRNENFTGSEGSEGENVIADPELEDKGWETFQILTFFASASDGQITHWIRAEIEDNQPENTRIIYRYATSNNGSFGQGLDDISKVSDSRMLKVSAYLQVKKEHLSQEERPSVISIRIVHSRGVVDLDTVKPTGVIVVKKSNNQHNDVISTESRLTWDYEFFDPQGKNIVDVVWGGDKREQYTTPGVYTVTLKLRNELNYWSNEIKYTFEVKDEKPVAVLEPDRNMFSSLISIPWDISKSYDPDEDGIKKVEWGGDANASHQYSSGTYTVTFRVQDNEGYWSDWISKTFTTVDTIFYDAPIESIDYNDNTYANIGTESRIHWIGNIENKMITLKFISYANYSWLPNFIAFFDDNGNEIPFFVADTKSKVQEYSPTSNSSYKQTLNLIVPKGATELRLWTTGGFSFFSLYEISIDKNYLHVTLPPVNNVTNTAEKHSITLNWHQSTTDYAKTLIFRDNNFIGETTQTVYTDTDLEPNKNYNYLIINVGPTGNYSEGVSYSAQTTIPVVIWQNVLPAWVDGNTSTYGPISDTQYTINWIGNLENRKITLNYSNSKYYSGDYNTISFLDDNNNIIPFVLVSDNKAYSTYTLPGGNDAFVKIDLIIPENAKKMQFNKTNSYNRIYIYEIIDYEDQIKTIPTPIKNITSSSAKNSITLSWEQTSSDYIKTLIYRNNIFVGETTTNTFTDNSLAPDTTYEYRIVNVGSTGDHSPNAYHTAKTRKPVITWNNTLTEWTDGDINTSSLISGTLHEISWNGNLANKQLTFAIANSRYSSGAINYIVFLDVDNNVISQHALPYNNDVRYNIDLTVPANATKIQFTKSHQNNRIRIYEIIDYEN